MLNMYLSDYCGHLQAIGHVQKDCWIDMVAPTAAEIGIVSDSLNIPRDFITDALDNYERARIEREGGALLIIVDFPMMARDEINGETFETMPMGIIITEQHFITVCLHKNPILGMFIANQVKGFFTFKKSRFALQILQHIAFRYLRDLKQLNKKTEAAEKILHESVKNKHLFEMMNIEKSLVYIVTSLKSNRVVVEKIMRQKLLKMYEDDEDLLEDVIIETSQALEMAEVHSNVLSGCMDAYASIIANNMNDVMKFLTLFTILLTVPTLVFSFYGMNVELPYGAGPFAWVTTLALSILLGIILSWILWIKKII